MKENKAKEVMDEVSKPEAQSQPRPFVGDKRKSLSKTLDLGNLPSRRGNKKAKHGLSKPEVVKPSLPTPTSQPSIQVHVVDSSVPIEVTPFKTIVPTLFQPSQRVPMNLVENEDLAWERFQKAVTDEDVVVCYDMSLKEFEHFVVHDLFKVCDFTFASSCHFTFFSPNKVFFLIINFFIFFLLQAMSKFITVSRQATEMDKIRMQLETRVQEVKDYCRGWAEVAAKAIDEAKEL